MEQVLSLSQACRALLSRLARYGAVCALVCLAAFIPLAGLTLLTPTETGVHNWGEFLFASSLLCRFLTPVAAVAIVIGLARRENRAQSDRTLWRTLLSFGLPAIALALAINFFTLFASLLLVLPGLGFLLGSSIALPILVVEQTSMTRAVHRSWERTRDYRRVILGYWLVVWGLISGFLLSVALLTTKGQVATLFSHPLAQSEALIPLTLAFSVAYSVVVVASYSLYVGLTAAVPSLDA